MRLVKAHALGNDFLLIEASELASIADRSALATK
jgi:diaminopimelate epimerase